MLPAGVTVTVAVAELLFRTAVNVAVVLAVTVPAVTVKLPVVVPEPTVTEAGVVSELLLSESVTTVLLDGACDSVTVQFDVPPEVTEVGEH